MVQQQNPRLISERRRCDSCRADHKFSKRVGDEEPKHRRMVAFHGERRGGMKRNACLRCATRIVQNKGPKCCGGTVGCGPTRVGSTPTGPSKIRYTSTDVEVPGRLDGSGLVRLRDRAREQSPGEDHQHVTLSACDPGRDVNLRSFSHFDAWSELVWNTRPEMDRIISNNFR